MSKTTTQFRVGRLFATPGALNDALSGMDEVLTLVSRHQHGDYGEVCEEDKKLNDGAIENGERIVSAYRTKKGKKVYVITEADRSATTVLLPEEY